MLNIILFGPPGAGKGTQAQNLKARYQLTHISTGDLFRAHIKGATELGRLAKSYIDQGNLVPDEVTIGMLSEAMEQEEQPRGFIFDGFPRTTAQAEALDALLKKKQTDIRCLLSLEVPEDELKARLKKRAEDSGRSDDANPEVIAHRLAVYARETAPVKDFYQKQGKLATVDGLGNIETVAERLYAALEAVKTL